MQRTIKSDGDGERPESRTELDSHANMAVVGKHCYILSESGKTTDVQPFSPDYKAMTCQIVDAAIQYDDPFTGQPYILVIRDALHVPTMGNNLIPPFMMREAGIQVAGRCWPGGRMGPRGG